jgi:hypothetical protein
VPSSWPSNCTTDIEPYWASFISTVPNNAVITFPPNGCYGQNATLGIPYRLNITINGNGSTFDNVSGWPTNYSVWRASGGSNINFENMTINGSDPTCAYNASYEWQYGIDYQATQGGTVNNVTINDVGGDFVEAEYDQNLSVYTSSPTENILVENSDFSCAGRMGVGLTDVNGFTMENTTISNVAWDAVDVEPDSPVEFGSNINITGDTFTNINFGLLSNGGQGWQPNIGNITFSGNTETNEAVACVTPISVGQDGATYRSTYTFTNNQFYAPGDGIDLAGADNVTISGNTIIFNSLGCGGTAYGVRMSDSHGVAITNNTFTHFGGLGGGGPDSVDDLSTNVTTSGNTVTD